MVELVGVEPTSERVHFGFHARRNRNNPIGLGGEIRTHDLPPGPRPGALPN